MKARKYKISKKPLNGVKENTSDHLAKAASYTSTTNTLPGGMYDSKVFRIEDKSIGVPYNKEASKEFEKEVQLLTQDMSKIFLKIQLTQALKNEDYERAAELRDKIQKK